MKFLHIYIGMIGLLGYASSPLVATERSLKTSSLASKRHARPIVQKDKKPALKEKRLELRSSYIKRLVNNTDAYAFYRSNMYEKDRNFKKYIQDNPAIRYLIDAMLYLAVLQEYSDFSDSQKESIKKVFRKKMLQAYYARKRGEDVLGFETRIFLINELMVAVMNDDPLSMQYKPLNEITFSFLLTSDKEVADLPINKEIMLLPNINNEAIEKKIVVFFNMILKNSVPKKDQYVFSKKNSDVPEIDNRWVAHFGEKYKCATQIESWSDFNDCVQQVYIRASPISLIDSSFSKQITGVFINMQSAFNALKDRDFKKAADQIQRIDAFLIKVENAFKYKKSPESFFSKTKESQEPRALTRQKDILSFFDEPQEDEPERIENPLYKNDVLLVQKMRVFFALILSSTQKAFFAMSVKDYQKIQSKAAEILDITKQFDDEASYLFYEYMAFVDKTVLPDLISSLKKQGSIVSSIEQSSHEVFNIDNAWLKFVGLSSMEDFDRGLDGALLQDSAENLFYHDNTKNAFYAVQEVFKMVQKRDFQSVATKIKELNGYLKNIEPFLKDKKFFLDVSFLQQVRGFFGLLLSKTQSYFSPMSLDDYTKVQKSNSSIVDSFSKDKNNFNTVFSNLFYEYFKFLSENVLPNLTNMQFGGVR